MRVRTKPIIKGAPVAMQAVQVRLSDEQLAFIDQRVASGRYPSRSEAIRDYLRKAQLWETLEKILALGDIDAPQGEVEARLTQIRQRVYDTLFAKAAS